MKKIKLYNRYNANLWLENFQDDYWKLKSENKSDLSYIRYIYNDNELKSIYAVDPSGGPFLYVGMQIDNYKIIEICTGLNFRLEELQ